MPPQPSEELPAARRQPLQARSQERRDRILAVAEALIAQKGSEPLKMSEVAQEAGISIGSLYQYFPDKRAVIRTLAEKYALACRAQVEAELAPVRDKAGLVAAFTRLMALYQDMMDTNPVMRDLHAGMLADKLLADLQVAESRAAGALLAAAILRAFPKADAKKVGTLGFLVWQLGEEAMRLALSAKRGEAKALIEAYTRMALRAITNPNEA
jgi:AcrR family transcriptional regulator